MAKKTYPYWDFGVVLRIVERAFYPEKLKADQRPHFYSEHFPIVEINNTFYLLPSDKTVKNWYEQTPSNFLFAIKASRYITHLKCLLAMFQKRAEGDQKRRFVADFSEECV